MRLKKKPVLEPVVKKTPPKKPVVKKEEPKYVIPNLNRPDITPVRHPGALSSGNGRRKTITNEVVVTMDEYTFRYVWEMLEARAHSDHQRFGSIPAVANAAENAVNAFRNSFAHTNGIEVPSKKRIVKKKAVK